MTHKQLNEGLDYHDMLGQVQPKLSVDEYKAKMGKDSEIVTLAFTVNSKLAGQDLVSWLEIGYDYVLDASVSDGEVSPGKYLVFVELDRRSNVPSRIIEMLEDLKTLTDLKVEDYKINVDDEEYTADLDTLKQVIITSPKEYKNIKDKDKDLNEMRTIANLDTKIIHDNDSYIKYVKAIAGI
jgi:hypothetical protein